MTVASDRLSPERPFCALNRRLVTGLTLLRTAIETARVVNRDVWEFAVEIDELHDVGLTNTDIRFLLSEGYVLRGVE